MALGQGHFGVVKKGIWHEDSGMMVVVAVKEGVAKEDKIKLLQEAAILSQFSHPNVLKLYGVVAEMGMVCCMDWVITFVAHVFIMMTPSNFHQVINRTLYKN